MLHDSPVLASLPKFGRAEAPYPAYARPDAAGRGRPSHLGQPAETRARRPAGEFSPPLARSRDSRDPHARMRARVGPNRVPSPAVNSVLRLELPQYTDPTSATVVLRGLADEIDSASREGRMCSARPLSELSRFRDRRLRSRRPRDAICSNDLRRPSSLSRRPPTFQPVFWIQLRAVLFTPPTRSLLAMSEPGNGGRVWYPNGADSDATPCPIWTRPVRRRIDVGLDLEALPPDYNLKRQKLHCLGADSMPCVDVGRRGRVSLGKLSPPLLGQGVSPGRLSVGEGTVLPPESGSAHRYSGRCLLTCRRPPCAYLPALRYV